MSFADALRTRFALARGESLGEALRIFLATKEERRRIAARKFPGRAVVPAGRGRGGREPPGAAVPPSALLDAAWYAAAHGLAGPEAAAGHFAAAGLARGFAPRPALAGADGLRLSPRGAEFLHRLGLPLGAPAAGAEAEGAGLDPWTIGNPDGRPVAVVTAVVSAGERLLPVPPAWTDRADFFAVSSFAFPGAEAWRIVRPVFHHPDERQVALFAKTHLATFFASYRRVLWVDPGVLPCADPADLALGSDAPFACFRAARGPLGAEAADLAASGRIAPDAVADALGRVAEHPALAAPGLPDASVLLLDPSDEPVRRLASAWWRHAMRLPGADGFALALALAEVAGVAAADLPGGTLDLSPSFARRRPA